MKKLIIIKAVVLLVLVALAVSSCTSTGYGCHGRGKIMTRVY
jgi:hypothetical protein